MSSPDEAATVTQALTGVVQSGTGTSAQVDGVPTAGKTGTTNDYKDAWFVGFTTHCTTGVWMGYTNPKSMKDIHGQTVHGGTFPAQIWQEHTARISGGLDPGTFPTPSSDGNSSTNGNGKRRGRSGGNNGVTSAGGNTGGP